MIDESTTTTTSAKQNKYFKLFYSLFYLTLVKEGEDVNQTILRNARNESKRLRKAIKTGSTKYKISEHTFFTACELIVKTIFPSQAVLSRDLDWSRAENSSFDKFIKMMPEKLVDFFMPLSFVIDFVQNTTLLKNTLAYFFTYVDLDGTVKQFIEDNIVSIITFYNNNTDLAELSKNHENIDRVVNLMQKDEDELIKNLNLYHTVDKNFNWSTSGSRILDRKELESESNVCLTEWLELMNKQKE